MEGILNFDFKIPEVSEIPGRRKSNPEQISKVIRKASKSFKKINVKQDATSTPDDYDEEREVLKMTFSQNPFNTMINKKHLSIDSPGLSNFKFYRSGSNKVLTQIKAAP